MVTGQSYDLRVDIASRDTTSKVGNSVCESVQIFLAHKGKASNKISLVKVSASNLSLYHKTLKDEFYGQLSKKIQHISKKKQFLGDLHAKVSTDHNS